MRTVHLKTTNKRSNACVRNVLGIVVLTVILSSSGSVLGFDDSPTKDPEVLLAVLLDESTPYLDRFSALQEVRDLPPGAKPPLLLSVIRNADHRLAMEGGFMAIREGIHTPDIIGAIRVRISNWTLPAGPGIVQAIVHEGLVDGAAEAVMPIVRDVLRLTARREPSSDAHQHELAVIAVNWAAFALVGERRQDDGELFRDAVRAYPEAYVGWLALYQLDAVDETMRTLARSVYSNDGFGNLARVGAAVAVHHQDEQAASVAFGLIRAYLEEFGGRSARELFPNGLNDRPARASYGRMSNEMGLIAFLRFLKEDEARELALNYIDSPNNLVGKFARLVAARRWPKEAKAHLATVPQSERAAILAMIDYFHPGSELALPSDAVKTKELDTAKKKITAELSRPHDEAHRLLLEW